MRVSFLLVGLTLSILPALPVHGGAEDTKPGDLDRWQGSWQMVLKERDGELLETGTAYITIDGSTVKTIVNGKSVETGNMTFDSAASPSRYDFKITADSDEVGRIFQGIYRIKGDSLETCVQIKPDGKRPTKFCTEPGSGTQLIVWRKFGSVLDKAQ